MVEITEISALNSATKKGESLKTTVPRTISKLMELEDKGRLEWELKEKGKEVYCIVRKV